MINETIIQDEQYNFKELLNVVNSKIRKEIL